MLLLSIYGQYIYIIFKLFTEHTDIHFALYILYFLLQNN